MPHYPFLSLTLLNDVTADLISDRMPLLLNRRLDMLAVSRSISQWIYCIGCQDLI